MCQNIYNNWLFGDKCYLDFSSGSPVSKENSAMTVTEGSSSISDKNGLLLFYTNGVKVWTRENKEMPNGKSLKGHDSSTQSAIIIPKPGNSNQYIIFTADCGDYDNPPNVGIHYSIVDMSRNNGLGDVIEKNILLLPSATEKLTAVAHSNGQDFWVVAHGWNTPNFYSYLVTKEGVSKKIIISKTGSIHAGGKTTSGNSIGQMKLSPDGKHLAVMMFDSKYFEIFNFNNSTGDISEPKIIYLPQDESSYGCEFSPNGKLLYVSLYWKNQVYQYDINLPSGAQILNSSIMIAQSRDTKLGAMQLAIDGKIYISKNSLSMAVINHPNIIGKNCDYEDDGLFIKIGKLQLGLPTFIQSYLYNAQE